MGHVSLLLLLWVLIAVETCHGLEGLPDDVNLNDAVANFQEWFAAGYGASCPVALTVAGDGMRLGVVATKRIPAESLYLSIPLRLTIYDDTIYSTPIIGDAIRRVIRRVGTQQFQPQQLALNLFLTHQRFVAKNKSFFHPYIQLIPVDHNVPEFYSDAELALLAGTLIPSKVRAQRARHATEYSSLKSALKEEAAILPLHTFTFENYVWAQGILNTRMIWWDGVPHLVPMLDMINCRQGPNPHRVHSTRRGPSNRADTYAPWTFEKGDQVFENYGQPNPTYMLWHGFTMIPNVHDCAQIELQPSDWSSLTIEHRRAISRLGLQKREYCLRPDQKSWDEFLTLARVIVSSAHDANHLKAPPQNLISRVNEGKALTYIKKRLLTHLSALASKETIDGMANDASSFRLKMIQAFLRTQYALLNETADAVEHKIAPFRRVPNKPPTASNPGPSEEL